MWFAWKYTANKFFKHKLNDAMRFATVYFLTDKTMRLWINAERKKQWTQLYALKMANEWKWQRILVSLYIFSVSDMIKAKEQKLQYAAIFGIARTLNVQLWAYHLNWSHKANWKQYPRMTQMAAKESARDSERKIWWRVRTSIRIIRIYIYIQYISNKTKTTTKSNQFSSNLVYNFHSSELKIYATQNFIMLWPIWSSFTLNSHEMSISAYHLFDEIS